MSIKAGLPPIQEKGRQKSFHQRHNNSGELDVFEAAGYFSGVHEIYGASLTLEQKTTRCSGKMSLDIPSSKRNSIPSPTHHQKAMKDEKQYKQSNSPSGKLASFLNSLFNQTSSKKKKSKTSSTQSKKDDQDHEIGRRKRRSSIGHFQSANTISSNCNSSASSSEFKIPPPYANTPLKNCYKDFQRQSDHNPDVTAIGNLSKINNINLHVKSSEKTQNSWLDVKFGTSSEFSSEKNCTLVNSTDEDDGADSDSSSDLFELQNFDLVSCYSSDLPVYETTHIDSIKRGAKIGRDAI